MKEYDERKSHISSKIHVIYTPSNNVRHPTVETFTTLHYTSPYYTSLHLLHSAKLNYRHRSGYSLRHHLHIGSVTHQVSYHMYSTCSSQAQGDRSVNHDTMVKPKGTRRQHFLLFSRSQGIVSDT